MGNSVQHSVEGEDRLDSWKEIAAFLGRGVRTVQRWELRRRLPVHRAPGGKADSVYAFKWELAEWMASSKMVERAGEHYVRPDAIRIGGDSPVSSADVLWGGHPLVVSHASAWLSRDDLGPATVLDGSKDSPSVLRTGLLDPWWVASVAVATICVLAIMLFISQPWVAARQVQVSHPLVTPHVPDPAAVELYLRGRYFWERRTPEDLHRAIDLFTQAIVRDPSYAQAYSGIADCYNLLREFSTMPPEEAYPRAIAAARRAVQLDDTSAEAYNSLAFGTLYWTWDPTAADQEFQRAIELKPEFVTAHHWYANSLMSRGRPLDALREIDIAQQLDPSSTAVLGSKGLILLVAGKTAEGLGLLTQLEAAEPNYLPPHVYMADFYLTSRDARRFLAEQKKLADLSTDKTVRLLSVAANRGYASGGYEGMVRSMLAAMEKLPEDGGRDPFMIARFDALLGDRSKAMRSLELAYQKHRESICFLYPDMALAPLRDEPKFQEMAALRYHPGSDVSTMPALAAATGHGALPKHE